MVGDICNADWLSEQLLLEIDTSSCHTSSGGGAHCLSSVYDHPSCIASDSMAEWMVESGSLPDASSVDTHSLQNVQMPGCCHSCPCDRQHKVVVLDCRAPNDYMASHIIGAVHLAIPPLMLRRLTSGTLPASSVIGCLQDDGREHFDRCSKPEIFVLHDECSDDVCSEATSLPTSGQVVSILLRRLKEDGCRVCLLKGGYEAFSQKYPNLCVKASDASPCCATTAMVADESDDGINVDDDVYDVDEFYVDNGTTCEHQVVGTSTALGLQRLRLNHRHHHQLAARRSNGGSSSVVGHHHPDCRMAAHRTASSCSSSISLSSLSSCCSSSSSAVSSSTSYCSMQSAAATTTSFPVEVLPYLYLGNARSSADLEMLHRNGIRYILNVTPDVPNSFANSDLFHYLQIPIDDHWSQDLTAYFPDAIAFIDEARRSQCGVLVHCLAGISRSVTVTVAYLMHSLHLSLNDAYERVRSCKPDVSPNFSFMGQLLDYERSLAAARHDDAVDIVSASSSSNLSASGAADSAASNGVVPTAALSSGSVVDRLLPSPVVMCSCSPSSSSLQPEADERCVPMKPPTRCAICRHRFRKLSPPPASSPASDVTDVRMSPDDVVLSNETKSVCGAGVMGMRRAAAALGTDGGVAGVSGSSCYSSPVSSLSSLSSSSAANVAVSSTSSSSAFEYEIPSTSGTSSSNNTLSPHACSSSS